MRNPLLLAGIANLALAGPTATSQPPSGVYIRQTENDPPSPTVEPQYITLGDGDVYQLCGITRAGRMLCPAGDVCIDNPDPWSCGQSCDDYSVCVGRDAPRCGGGVACADNGRCKYTLWDCIVSEDGTRCEDLCFKDYWPGRPN